MTFKCPFCQKDCTPSYFYGYCKPCKVHFSFDVDNVMAQIHFSATLHAKRYELVLFLLNKETHLIYWEPFTGYSMGAEPDMAINLATFPEVLKITPQNLHEKLHMMLTFL